MTTSDTPVGAEIDVVRVVYPDLLGVDRGRDVLRDALAGELTFCRAVYHTSPQGNVVAVPGGLDAGLPDVVLRPDLDTLRPVPWEPGVAWCIADAFEPGGQALPECPRNLLRRVVAQ